MRLAALPLALLGVVGVASSKDKEITVWATPHEQYSSSVGVLGCKINTNRVAYWPAPIHCSNICVELSYEGRSVKLLRIDQSEGAYDVSYDAWNYLYTGHSARDEPTTGGAVEMQYRNLSASACKDLINTDGSRLPLSASNSMNFLASCLDQPDTWVAQNHILYNVLDPICSRGHDEKCTLDWPDANQAQCPNMLGDPADLTSAPVYNIQYGTGESILAATGEKVDGVDNASGRGTKGPGIFMLVGVFVGAVSMSNHLYPLLSHL